MPGAKLQLLTVSGRAAAILRVDLHKMAVHVPLERVSIGLLMEHDGGWVGGGWGGGSGCIQTAVTYQPTKVCSFL